MKMVLAKRHPVNVFLIGLVGRRRIGICGSRGGGSDLLWGIGRILNLEVYLGASHRPIC